VKDFAKKLKIFRHRKKFPKLFFPKNRLTKVFISFKINLSKENFSKRKLRERKQKRILSATNPHKAGVEN
jgi:hypothetical protein